MNYESIAKIILGSGFFAFLISELIGFLRRLSTRKKYIKAITHELFSNEYVLNMIIKDFQHLQINPCGYMNRHRFMTQIMESVISSVYLMDFSFELSQFILEYRLRFDKIQYELSSFFMLKDEEKLKEQNQELLKRGEADSRLLLTDLRKSTIFKKLKKKYKLKWHKEKIRLQEKKTDNKMSIKDKKKQINELKKEIQDEIRFK